MFTILIAICLTWNNEKAGKHTGVSLGWPVALGPSPAFPPLRFPADPQVLPRWLERGTAAMAQPQHVASSELRRHCSPYALLQGKN